MGANENKMKSDFFNSGWCRFPLDPDLVAWVQHSLPAARYAVAEPDNRHWFRCGGTWFVGVHALPNDGHGAVGQGPRLKCAAVDFITHTLGLNRFEWDRGQISVCYPGFPQPMDTESDAAYRFRLDRDSAHVDGLLAEGGERRRHLREHHAFILGIPLVETDAKASPFVVWEGSHVIIKEVFRVALEGIPAHSWCEVDITNDYHAARRQVFESCRRIEIPARPGEAYLVHRLALHGMAPWRSSSTDYPDGRMICYFRPEIGGPFDWLLAA